MDYEKLIEFVRARECLYNMANKKYSDHHYKERVWNEISKELQQPAKVCKKTWASLRDAFRRAMKKYITTSGGSLKNVRKWKYEVEMSFLKPHIKERFFSTSGEEEFSEHLQNVNESHLPSGPTDRQDNFDTQQSTRSEDGESDGKRSKLASSSESASSTLTEFILNNSEDKSKATEGSDPNAIDQFFSTMSTTVKSFTPYYQHLAKTRVFFIISKLEFQQLPPQM